MINDIISCQNENDNIIKLAAMRELYSIGKMLMEMQYILDVPIMIILALLPILFTNTQLATISLNKENLNLFISFYSIIITIMDYLCINPLITKYKHTAACIQENFDCTVLSLKKNEIKDLCFDNEDISKYANKYKKKDPEFINIKNWYTPDTLNTLPLPVARIICQRTNCWWDSILRKKFRRDIKISSFLLFFILFLISLVGGLTVPKFITNVIFPFLPGFIFSIRQIQDNTTAIENLEKRKNNADELWSRILEEPLNFNNFENLSRELQDEIFENRKNSPLIFDWYYRIYKKSQQFDTDYSGDRMVKTYNLIVNHNQK